MAGIQKGQLLYHDAFTNEDSFFEEIMTVLITSFGFVISAQLVKTKSSPVLQYPKEEYVKVDFPFAAIGEQKIYSFKIFEILGAIVEREEMTSVEYDAYEKTLENISNVEGATVFDNQDIFYFIRKVISGSFLTYYEKIKDTIFNLYGTDPLQWPTELQFARVVRNAFAHHNLITISNPNVPPVNWRHLTYGSQDNGRNIFADFFVVELIDLMKDLEPRLH